nr:hypothetical protein [uncultured bacterium]
MATPCRTVISPLLVLSLTTAVDKNAPIRATFLLTYGNFMRVLCDLSITTTR